MSDLLGAAQPVAQVSFPTSPAGHQRMTMMASSNAFGGQMLVYVCQCNAILTGQGPDMGTAAGEVQSAYQAHLPA